MQLCISEEGRVIGITVSEPFPHQELIAASKKVAWLLEFEPALQNGVATPSIARLQYRFKLE